MSEFSVRLTLVISLLVLSACSSSPPKTCTSIESVPGCVFAPRESDRTETEFRKWVDEPNWPSLSPDRIGVSLAGGGSKASAFGMGVLAGLDDIGYLGTQGNGAASPQVALISSVSGGSYAAYYFFTQAITDRLLGTKTDDKQTTRYEHLFADGLTYTRPENKIFHPDLLGQLGEQRVHGADLISNAIYGNADPHILLNRRQSVVRCTQDLLMPGKCDGNATNEDMLRVWSSNIGMLLPTALSLVPHHLLNTVFDNGVNVSPSRAVYRRGIGLTYGSTPLRSYRGPLPHDSLATDTSKVAHDENFTIVSPRIPCPLGDASDLDNSEPDAVLLPADQRNGATSFMINCRSSEHQRFPRSLGFKDMKPYVIKSGDKPGEDKLPFWVIQATATQYRSLGGWFTPLTRDPFLNSFEMTPLSFGSRRYGFVKGNIDGMSVLDAVSASAAFLDANQQAYHEPWESVSAGLIQHLLNLNWGFDIPNPSVSPDRRGFHRILPLPVQWVDTAADYFYWSWKGDRGELTSMKDPKKRSPSETDISEEDISGPRHDRHRSAFIRLIDGGGSENLGAIGPIRRGFKTLVIADSAQDGHGEFADICYLKTQLEGLNKDKVPEIIGHENAEKKEVYLRIPGLKDLHGHCEKWKKGLNDYYNLRADTRFTTPALLGCITQNKKDENCQESDVLTRLVIIKPMLNERLLKMPLEKCTVGRRLYSIKSDEEGDCTGGNICAAEIPCEVARLMSKPAYENFPQTGTVTTTGNSSAELYASYRELARLYVIASKKAIQSAAGDPKEFAEEIGRQSENGRGLTSTANSGPNWTPIPAESGQ